MQINEGPSSGGAIKKVLVTGGTGFLGAYIICNLLEKGYHVRALRRTPVLPSFIEPARLKNVEWIQGDLLDTVSLTDAIAGMDAIIHAGATVSFREADRKAMYQINIDGTANMVNIALEQQISRFVHVSSVAALGRTLHNEWVDEKKKWDESGNHTHYAITKYQGEMQVWRAFAEGLPGVIINPSTILGYGNWNHGSCALFKNAYREYPWYTNGVNGFVGVEDVAEAAVQLMQSDITEQRFVVNADNWSFKRLFTEIATCFHKNPPRRHATPFIGNMAWRMEKIRSLFTRSTPLLTRETARVAQSHTQFNAAALLNALPGFQFTPLEKVIENACKKYEEFLTMDAEHRMPK